MEDFQSAFTQRHLDVAALDAAKRRTAAMHLGGIAVECLLKSIICASLPTNADGTKEWKLEANDPGHTIRNPGHDYEKALNSHNQLRAQTKCNPGVRKWFSDVEKPGGDFIDMRYLGYEPDEEKYKKWKQSYSSLVGWLQKQATMLNKGK